MSERRKMSWGAWFAIAVGVATALVAAGVWGPWS
jgi:hypothetical protein